MRGGGAWTQGFSARYALSWSSLVEKDVTRTRVRRPRCVVCVVLERSIHSAGRSCLAQEHSKAVISAWI